MEIRQRLELEDVEALVDVVELLPLLPLVDVVELLPLLPRPLRVDGVAAAGCGGDVNNCAPA